MRFTGLEAGMFGRGSTTGGNRGMAGAPETDAALLARFVGGEAEAFDRLFLKYQDYVYNICLGILGNSEDARDCAQETFLHAYRGAKSFRGQSQFSTWIYRIAVNNCRGLLRKRPRTPVTSWDDPDLETLPDPGPAPWRDAERQAAGDEVRQVIAGLSPDYRTVLVLRYFQELSYEEMQHVLGWSLPQVKVKLHRARRAFANGYAKRPAARESES